jgi:hypothetical protein
VGHFAGLSRAVRIRRSTVVWLVSVFSSGVSRRRGGKTKGKGDSDSTDHGSESPMWK